MSRRVDACTLLAFLASLVCALPAQAAVDLLANGSMSAGDGLPAGWQPATTDEGPGKLVASRDTTVFKSGPAALRVTAVGGAATGNVSCPLAGLAGRDLAICGWVKAEGKVDYASLAVLSPGAEPGYLAVAEFRAAPRWQRINTRVQLPANGQDPRLMLVFHGEGSAWLDELEVLPADQFQPEPVVTEFAQGPLYAFSDWQGKVIATEDGLRVQGMTGRGGAGFLLRADVTPFTDRAPALTLTAGPGHRAKGLRLELDDVDDTGHEYSFDLSGLQPGETATVTAEHGASVAEPGKVANAGKAAGFAGEVVQIKVLGDWSDAAVDLTLQRLSLVEPTAEMLAAREQHRQQLAAAAERARHAEQERAARLEALLAGAPHPEDGPDIRHVAPVAPDMLALRVQEKTFVRVPQVPYAPQEGDEIRRSDSKVWVVEQGELKEAEKTVAVFRRQGNRMVKLGDLAINAGMLKQEDQAVGQDLTAESVAEPRAYRLTAVDDPAWGQDVQPVEVAWKRKPNGYRSLTHEVDVYLKLPKPMTAGRTYRLAFPGVNFRQATFDYTYQPSTQRSPAVHVTAIGYRPDDPFKQAWLSQWMGTGGPLDYPEGLRFQLLDDATGQAVFEGTAERLVGPGDAETFKAGRNYGKTEVHALNFSAVNRPGTYRVFVAGIGCSYPFRIAPDVWTAAFRLSMKGLLHHRSGIELGPPFTDYVRPRPMHPADGVRIYASEGSEAGAGGQDGAFSMLAEQRREELLPEAWGGHMDAGDWDRNGKHPAAMWLLLDLYEIYPERIGGLKLALPPAEAGNAVPDILDEVLWNLDMHRRLQTAAGGVGGGIESTSHPRPGEASWQESLMISAYAPDPLYSLVYAGSAAKLARLLAPSDAAQAERFATSAERAWTWALAQTEPFLGSLKGEEQGKVADSIANARNLAALELWLLTGQPAYHQDFAATTYLGRAGDPQKQLKAVVRYARLPDGQGDAALRQAAQDFILEAANTALEFARGNAFGVTTSVPQLPPMGYVGYLSAPEMIGAVLPHAWLLTKDEKYLAGAVRATQFAAGANPMNLALTTGLGPNPVLFPLHIDSLMTGQPAPAGITVYGISDPAENYAFDAWAYQWYHQKMVPNSRTWPAHESYWDIYTVPSTNEYTIHQTIIPSAFYWGFLAARPGE